jgi:hypothetical protein
MADHVKTEPTYERDLTGLLNVDPYNDFLSEGRAGRAFPGEGGVREEIEAVRAAADPQAR